MKILNKFTFAVFAVLALAVVAGCSVPIEGVEKDGGASSDDAPDDSLTAEDGGVGGDDGWEENDDVPFVSVDDDGTAELTEECLDDGSARAAMFSIHIGAISPRQRSMALITLAIEGRDPIPFFEITPDLEGPWLDRDGSGNVDPCFEPNSERPTHVGVWLVNNSDDDAMISYLLVLNTCAEELGEGDKSLWEYENGYPVIGPHQKVKLGYVDQTTAESVFHPACTVHLENL